MLCGRLFVRSQPFTCTSKFFGIAFWFFQKKVFYHVLAQANFSTLSGLCTLGQTFAVAFVVVFCSLKGFTFQHFQFMYLLSDCGYLDANLLVLMRHAYVSFRQNLCYIYTVQFDIFTTLFQQFLIVLNTKYVNQIRQVYLLTPSKERCYSFFFLLTISINLLQFRSNVSVTQVSQILKIPITMEIITFQVTSIS